MICNGLGSFGHRFPSPRLAIHLTVASVMSGSRPRRSRNRLADNSSREMNGEI